MDGGLLSPVPDRGAQSAVRAWRRHVVSAFDLDQVFANMPKWQIEHEILSRPQGVSTCATLLLDDVGLASNRLSGRVRATGGTPEGQLAIGLDIACPPGRQFGGRALTRNDVLFGYGGAELDYLHPAGFNDLSMILPGTLVESVLEHRLAAPLDLSRFRTARVGDAGVPTRPDLWRLFGSLAAVLHGEQPMPDSPMAVEHLRAEVLDAIGSLIGRYLDVGGDEPVWHHRRPVAMRAAEYMRANLGEAMTLDGICAAARASERTVEYAFRDVFGVGAKRYLKLLRLNAVRRQLLRRAPEAIVIQDLAQDAGFWHMGHFSADYRRLFGETPSDTLRLRFERDTAALSRALPADRR
jgi:AraC family ethanolamine operon transcriptional activator